jgi:hypothetical protein
MLDAPICKVHGRNVNSREDFIKFERLSMITLQLGPLLKRKGRCK